jgi:putative ABC transport system permease protein
MNTLHSLLLDLRFAFRSFARERKFALVAVLVLALGISTSTVVFSVFYHLLFNAFSARDAGRLAVPSIKSEPLGKRSGVDLRPLEISPEHIRIIREENHVFEDIVGYTHEFTIVSEEQNVHQLFQAIVTANAFNFYGVAPLLGRGIVPSDGAASATPVFVIGYKAWRNEFNGDPNIVGKSFNVNGERRICVGVMPAHFQAYGAQVQAWMPYKEDPFTAGNQKVSLYTLARLKPNVSVEAAGTELDVILKRLATVNPKDFPKESTARVLPATDVLMGPWGIGVAGSESQFFNTKRMLYDLLGAVMVLLLIACCNVANLLLARATARRREIAIRTALGASRRQLLRLLFVESFALAICASVVGCIFAYFGMKLAATMIPQKGIAVGGEAAITLDNTVLLFALGITVLTIVICGLAPAAHMLGGDLRARLSGLSKAAAGLSHGRLRSMLVIGEVALSIVLLIGAGLMIRSVFAITHVDLGFDSNHLLLTIIGSAPGNHLTPEQREIFLPRVIERVKAIPGVTEAAINNSLPGYNPGRRVELSLPGSTYSEQIGLDACSESLIRVLGLHVKQGRWLSQSDIDSRRPVAVLNETMARHFCGDQDPLGQQIKAKGFDKTSQPPQDLYLQVIGVVNDIKDFGPQVPVIPMAFIPHTLQPGGLVLLRTSVDPRSVMHAVQQQIWEIDRETVFAQFEPLKDTLDRLTYSAPKLGLKSLGYLAAIALLLVAVGVFSVMAYTVELQTHDIGIRMALGAEADDIVQMVLRKGALLVFIGIGIGVLVSLTLTRLLASQIWGVPRNDPWTFTAAALCIVAAAFVACLVPARRASRVDPVIALRHE